MIKPTFVMAAVSQKTDYGRFVFEPLEQGYGHTLGNSLRRVLLTSLQGSAVTQVKIDGVCHQFSTISGMTEDVVELILNIKQIKLEMGKKVDEAVLKLSAQGPKTVTAKDITVPSGVKVVNPEQEIAKLADKKSKLILEMTARKGIGYSPCEDHKSRTIGVIPVDAFFSPVVKVNYKVEATRVGGKTDFDKLILEVWTDKTVKAKTVVEEAAQILEVFFRQITNPAVSEKEDVEPKKVDENLLYTVEELDLPTRVANALRSAGYKTVGDLVKTSKSEIAKVKNIGGKSLKSVENKLKDRGVSLKEK